MLGEMIFSELLDGLAGHQRQRQKPRELRQGDVACVGDGILKRYGIWTGTSFIQYAENGSGKRVVHETSRQDFLRDAEQLAVCEFPERYGHPTEWKQPIFPSSVVMPQERLWRMLAQGEKARKYKVYGPEETVARAKSRLGETGFLTSEHFAMWCKTGIAESHRLEKLRDWLDMIVVY